jgi:putative membrane protein
VLRLVQPQVAETEWPLIVEQGVLGPRDRDSFTNSPRRAWWIRPFSYRRNGFRLTPDVLLLRRGAVWRKLAILPLARLQSIGLHQGPLDRLTRVASLRGHVVSGPVYAHLAAIDRDEALRLFDDVAQATVDAAGGDRSHRWAEAELDLATAPVAGQGATDTWGQRADEPEGPAAPAGSTAEPAAGAEAPAVRAHAPAAGAEAPAARTASDGSAHES